MLKHLEVNKQTAMWAVSFFFVSKQFWRYSIPACRRLRVSRALGTEVESVKLIIPCTRPRKKLDCQDVYLCGMLACLLELQTKVREYITITKKAPIGHSLGWKCIPALSHLRHHAKQELTHRAGGLKFLCMKGAKNQEKALVGAFSVIVKSSQTYVWSSTAYQLRVPVVMCWCRGVSVTGCG